MKRFLFVVICCIVLANCGNNAAIVIKQTELQTVLRLQAKVSLRIAEELELGIISPERIRIYIKATDLLLESLRETLLEIETVKAKRQTN